MRRPSVPPRDVTSVSRTSVTIALRLIRAVLLDRLALRRGPGLQPAERGGGHPLAVFAATAAGPRVAECPRRRRVRARGGARIAGVAGVVVSGAVVVPGSVGVRPALASVSRRPLPIPVTVSAAVPP